MGRFLSIFITLLLLGAVVGPITVFAQPDKALKADTRCQICGMFVAKYPNWVTMLKTPQGERYFDGVKDLMVFVLNSEQYSVSLSDIKEIWVKDYYTLEWTDAKACFFVVGSDIYGPMGHEFIPFNSRAGAENFLADHGGRKILKFSDITIQRVDSMRVGQTMR